jgi:hypothetical protein
MMVGMMATGFPSILSNQKLFSQKQIGGKIHLSCSTEKCPSFPAKILLRERSARRTLHLLHKPTPAGQRSLHCPHTRATQTTLTTTHATVSQPEVLHPKFETRNPGHDTYTPDSQRRLQIHTHVHLAFCALVFKPEILDTTYVHTRQPANILVEIGIQIRVHAELHARG